MNSYVTFNICKRSYVTDNTCYGVAAPTPCAPESHMRNAPTGAASRGVSRESAACCLNLRLDLLPAIGREDPVFDRRAGTRLRRPGVHAADRFALLRRNRVRG